MEKRKRLKRGLKDISPLFNEEKKKPLSISKKVSDSKGSAKKKTPQKNNHNKGSQKIETEKGSTLRPLSVFSADHPEDSAFIATYVASKMINRNEEAIVLSVSSKKGSEISLDSSTCHHTANRVKHMSLSYQELHEILKSDRFPAQSLERQPILFMNFNLLEMPKSSRVLSLVDRWILHAKPTMESMCEILKVIKGALSYNPVSEFYLLYDGVPTDDKATQFYEMFSEFVSKRLGIQLFWLGSLYLGDVRTQVLSKLALDRLSMQTLVLNDHIEKRLLSKYINFAIKDEQRISA